MKKFAIVASVALVAYWLWPTHTEVSTDDVHTAEKEADIFDRLWITELPDNPRKKVDVLVVLKEDGPVGVFQNTSAYEGDFSVFGYKEGKQGTLAGMMLQSKQTFKLKWEVSTKGCDFDYCLKVKGAPRGAPVYGSMKDWEIGSLLDVEDVKARVLMP